MLNTDSGCMLCLSLQTGWERLELLTRSAEDTYLDRGAHTPEDSWGQSVPRRSFRCPYSTWMLAGSLRPGCGRDVTITLWKDIPSFVLQLAFLISLFLSAPAFCLELIWKLTQDCSGCSAGPDWRPCSGTALQRKPWVSADRSTSSNTRWWLTCWHADRCYTWPPVSAVYDLQWSTGWSLDSSSTSHPPLSTLPTRLLWTEGGEKQHCIAHLDTGLNVKLLWVSYPPLLLLSTSFLGTLSCLQHSAKSRQICWPGEENQWTCRLREQKQAWSEVGVWRKPAEKKFHGFLSVTWYAGGT